MTYIPIHPDKVEIRENNGKDKNGKDEFVTFGPFLKNDCFCIEEHLCVQKITHIKPVEFLLLHKAKIWLIEVKSSAPNKTNKRAPTEPDKSKFKLSFDEFIDDIKEKFIHSFLFTMANCLKRHSDSCYDGLPSGFKNLTFEKEKDFCFVLVIPKHRDNWLEDIQYELDQAMKPLIKSWNLPATSVKVWNEQLAKDNGFITP